MRMFSIECKSLQTLIKSSLNVEKVLKNFALEGEHYLIETFEDNNKYYLVVKIWYSEE